MSYEKNLSWMQKFCENYERKDPKKFEHLETMNIRLSPFERDNKKILIFSFQSNVKPSQATIIDLEVDVYEFKKQVKMAYYYYRKLANDFYANGQNRRQSC